MQLRDAIRVARQWVPFTARTVGYGTISLTLGPLTQDHRASLWAMKRWCKSSARGLHIDVDATGLENVPTDGAYVYASNHQSLLDILVLGAVLPGDFKWAAKRELMNIPFLGWHLKLAGHVPVERGGGPRVAAEVIKRFTEVLKRGKPLLIFPEGTRSEDGVLKDFKMGGFYAAVRAGVPVVPVALEGAGHLMHKGAIDSGDGNMRLVRVRVGKPIHPITTGKESARVVDLRDRTHAAVAELLLGLGGRVAEAPSKGNGSANVASSADS